MIEKNFCIPHGFDKDGRPIVWIRFANFTPENMNKLIATHFLIYILDHVCSLMKPNVDQMIMIYDMENAWYSNFSSELA